MKHNLLLGAEAPDTGSPGPRKGKVKLPVPVEHTFRMPLDYISSILIHIEISIDDEIIFMLN